MQTEVWAEVDSSDCIEYQVKKTRGILGGPRFWLSVSVGTVELVLDISKAEELRDVLDEGIAEARRLIEEAKQDAAAKAAASRT